MVYTAALRNAIRNQRRELPPQVVERLSRAAQGHILGSAAWHAARSVGLYMAVKGETRTDMLCQAAWDAGKTVLLPHIPQGTEGIMFLLPYAGPDALVRGRFGIPEPPPVPALLPPDGAGLVPDILIVPGVAFDTEGRRVGNGGGYYDRLLARPSMGGVPRIALAYAFQVSADPIPAETWDMPMDAIATEEGLLWLHPTTARP